MLTATSGLDSLHLVDYIHTLRHSTEHCIPPSTPTRSRIVQESIVSDIDKELRSRREGIVGPSHRECTTEVLETIGSLMRYRIACCFFSHSRLESSPLYHESWDHAMPYSIIIVAIRDVFAEIRDSDGSFGIIEFEGDITERGSEEDVFHGR
jgi:hypothetical protein